MSRCCRVVKIFAFILMMATGLACSAAALPKECVRSAGMHDVTPCHDKKLHALNIDLEHLNEKWKVARGEALVLAWHQTWANSVRRRCKSLACLHDAYEKRISDLDGICTHAPGADEISRKKLNPETNLGILCRDEKKDKDCLSAGLMKTLQIKPDVFMSDPDVSELVKSGYIINMSSVDVDNDGREEIRVWATVGSAQCVRSVFFKLAENGTYRRLDDKKYDMFTEEARFCGGDAGSFVRIGDINYFLEPFGETYNLFMNTPKELYPICTSKPN